jgi:hypothetical protein
LGNVATYCVEDLCDAGKAMARLLRACGMAFATPRSAKSNVVLQREFL